MYLKSVDLENVKGFRKLSFDFQRPDRSYAGWTVILGGNSSGKSSLLKAIAMCMLGNSDAEQLAGSNAGWVRKGAKKASARIALEYEKKIDTFAKTAKNSGGGKLPRSPFDAGLEWIAGKNDRAELVPLAMGGATSNRGPWNINSKGWFCAGYGPMRRLSGSSTESMRYSRGDGGQPRFVSLFREDAALSESEEWLKKCWSRYLQDKVPAQEEFVDGVKALLSDNLLPLGMKIAEITVDHVFVETREGVRLPLRDVSDGCRSIYATILDLVHAMSVVYGESKLFREDEKGRTVVDRPGVVLIDEIEAHLHPSWQREIPEWLKIHFPKIQFLVTTHSPLVAQAADDGGIFSLPMQGEKGREPRELSGPESDKIRLGKAEKTLLGNAFGLSSTRSTWALEQIERWKRLDARKRAGIKLPDAEQRELKRLSEQMRLAFEDEG
jgi:predicted ATPase